MSTHTPTPWKRGEKKWDGDPILVILGPNGEEVCQEPTEFSAYASGAFVSADGITVNLDFIVTAVNAHSSLVEAARAAQHALYSMPAMESGGNLFIKRRADANDKINAALTLAESTEEKEVKPQESTAK